MELTGDSPFREVKEDLSFFGLSVKDDCTLADFVRLSTKYCLTFSSLVEKYVAFRQNQGLSDCLSAADITLFEKESLIPSVGSKSSRVFEIKAHESLNGLPHEMRKELLSNSDFGVQKDIMNSYLLDESDEVLRPINIDNSPILSSPSIVKSSGRVLCSFSKITEEKSENVLSFGSYSHNFNWEIRSMNLNKSASVRYMYQRPLTKADVLDSWTWEQVKRVVKSLPSSFLHCSEITISSQRPRFSLSSVLDPSKHQRDHSNVVERPATSLLRPINDRLQSTSLVAGRVAVAPDSGSSTNQRLHPSNACIVGTRRAGGGDLGRVSLDLTTNAESLQYSLYTGQPVVFKATNVSGRSLTAAEFFTPKVNPPADISKEVFPADEPDLHVVVACGPFTTNTSHDIAPLLHLLRSIKDRRPHVLILLGPLVDSSHPQISEFCDSTFEELYQSRMNTIAEWCYLLKTKLVLVSSWREVCGSPVYPTPPHFSSSKPAWAVKNPEVSSWYDDVTFVWDPSTVKIGPYSIGMTSPDILFQMSSEEINVNCTEDRLSRLCRHVLASGTYYPVLPPEEALPFDYPLWWEHARLPADHSPHCLVVPSKLKCFIKDVEGVVCVNPGLTARPSNTTGGSYARLVFSSRPAPPTTDTGAVLRGRVTIQGEVVQL